jgi:DnaJ-class molecular chaperone
MAKKNHLAETIDNWKKVIEGRNSDKENIEIIDCEECGGTGFSNAGTGYDSVCDNCGGLGRLPK